MKRKEDLGIPLSELTTSTKESKPLKEDMIDVMELPAMQKKKKKEKHDNIVLISELGFK